MWIPPSVVVEQATATTTVAIVVMAIIVVVVAVAVLQMGAKIGLNVVDRQQSIPVGIHLCKHRCDHLHLCLLGRSGALDKLGHIVGRTFLPGGGRRRGGVFCAAAALAFGRRPSFALGVGG